MEKRYTQLRIWRTTLTFLRRIHAETGESLISIIDRLAKKEWEGINENISDI